MFFRKRAETASDAPPPPPKPTALPPSGTFDGNDGEWSTFWINIGDSVADGGGQNFKVLVSTSSPLTIVPGESSWCIDDCPKERGVQIFQGEQSSGLKTTSSSWQDAGIYDIPLPYWWSNKNQTEDPRGLFGLDNVGLGESSKDSLILSKQYVVAFTSRSNHFFMGQFGLAAGPVMSVDPFLTSSATRKQTPSVSYGYTAGASYKNGGNGALGNLVLGGYDETRVDVRGGVSIRMPNAKNNTLVVGVQSILYKPDPYVDANIKSFTTESKGFSAAIDSTLPYLWLPDEVCDHFVQEFNLKYDNDTELYTINSSAAQNNRIQNATVSFKIGESSLDSTPFSTINLPYSAFDLPFKEPPNGNETRYFPIKKSPDGVFVLGRTFLQESYIIVDYERANFTVGPALSPQSVDAKLVPIYNKSYVPPSPTPLPESGGGGLSGGAIAGIVVGIVVVFLGAALGFFFWWKKRRAAQNAPPNYKEATEIDTSAAGNEVKHQSVSELASEPPGSPRPSMLGGYYGERGRKDWSPFPAISEMDSPPAELYSPPTVASTPHTDGSNADYFTAGGKLGHRGGNRDISAHNTPGTPLPSTPIAELPGDDGRYQAGGSSNRGPSETASLQYNIDEVMKRPSADPSPARPEKAEPSTAATVGEKKSEKADTEGDVEGEEPLERRPSHTRGLSDTTVQSDTTVVSQPTPEELERWALAEDEQPRRPLSE